MTMIAVCALWGMLFSVLLAEPVQAADLIRALMFQEAQRVLITSGRGLVRQFPDGAEQVMSTPVVVTQLDGGMTLNGARAASDMVKVRGRDDDLIITVAETPVSDQPQDRLSDKVSDAAGSAVPPAELGPPPMGALRGPAPLHTLVLAGAVQVIRRGKSLMVINEVDLEEYVKGVVPSEMSSGWHLEALKAQAVAARTYALYQRMMNAGRDYDVVAGVQDQVYRGRRGVDERVQQAVEATRGVVLMHQNAPVFAAFSSTAAGPTEDAINVWSKDLPYLKGVECPFDANSPYYRWRAELSLQDLENNLRHQGIAVGTIASVTPFSFSRAGRVGRLRILHSEGELILRGTDFRRVVGYTAVRSTQFEVQSVGRTIVLAGRGSGHAVGLCQWGAKELAELGYSFAVILTYYFPGTEFNNTRFGAQAPSSTP